jgi:large subunit ribosomal protein L24e
MECTFCKQGMPAGTGTLYIQKTGKTLAFCSSKCEKNQIKLGRTARKTQWSGHAKKVKKND